MPQKKSKRCFFTVSDNRNLPLYEGLKNSLAKFHPNEELKLFNEEFVKLNGDPAFYYRATPFIAKLLMEEGYDEVCKLDADQIITGDLSDIWNIDADVEVVLNDPNFPIHVWDILPYYNNGLVVLKSREFVNHWLRLCNSPHFDRYQFREQDLLNILASDYLNYKVECLENTGKVYGEFAKSLWPKAFIRDDKIFIQYPDGDRQLCVVHFGGGNDPSKGNYRLRFNEEVVKRLDELVKQ